MGTVYVLLNKTKNESVRIDGVGQKYFELMAKKYSNFVLFLMLNHWKGDHVILVSDNNSFDYGEEYYNSHDVSKEHFEDFLEEVKEHNYYYELDVGNTNIDNNFLA